MKTTFSSVLFSAVACLGLLGAASKVAAATYVVANLNDSGVGSLRQGLTSVTNGDVIDATGVSGTILLTSGELLVTNSVTILGPGAASLAINGNAADRVLYIAPNLTVTIAGLGITNGVNLSGDGGGIYNDGASLTVSNCAIRGNYAQETGGGLFNAGTMMIVNSTVSGNNAGDGSSIFPFGGGIANGGTLTIKNSTITGNSAYETGGGLASWGTALLVNCTFSGNTATTYGDGIYTGAALTIGSTILNASSIRYAGGSITSSGYNLSSDNGGGFLTNATDILNTNPQLGALQNNGGQTLTYLPACGSSAIGRGYNFGGASTDQRGFPRIAVGSVTNAVSGDGTDIGAVEMQFVSQTFTVINTNDSGPGSLRQAILDSDAKPCAAGSDTILFDPAVTGKIKLTSGELFITHSLSLNGPGAAVLALEGSGSSRVLHISGSIVVSIAGLTITNGIASGSTGGGVSSQSSTVSVRDCVICGSSASSGGGLYSQAGSLTVSNCTVRGNSASNGGGVYNDGGGVGITATLTLVNSTVSSNSASITAGGILNNGNSGGNGTVNVRSCTVSGNSAATLANAGGGGIFNRAAGSGGTTTLSVLNSTVSGNFANGGCGGIFALAGTGSTSVVQIGSTILNAGASGANLISSNSTFVSLGFNVSSDAAGAFLNQATDQTNSNPLLGPLQNNGGSTFTHALFCGSPALNRGTNFIHFSNDQRGSARTYGSAAIAGGDGTDIGAFEIQTDCTIVTSTNDSGDGSLRAALASAVDGNTINATGVTGTIRLSNGGLSVTKSVSIRGPGPGLLAVNGNGTNSGFYIDAGKTVTVSDLTITNCTGGIYNYRSTLTVSNCSVVGNSGGAIYNDGGGAGNGATLTILDSTVSRNGGYTGGGVHNDGTDGGNALVTIRNSTFAGNSGSYGGGAIWNDGEYNGGVATVAIYNSTFSSNTAAYYGGAIRNDGRSSGNAFLSIFNCTLSDNFSPTNGSVVLPEASGSTIDNEGVEGNATMEIGSSILKTAATGTNFANKYGVVISHGYNLSSDDSSALLNQPTDSNNLDPLLGPLQDNGGPTFTRALLPGSPAVDKGSNFIASVTDQRGTFSRTADDPGVPNAAGGDGTDIGAFEVPLPSTVVVNTADSGSGSLRYALSSATNGATIYMTGITGTIALTNGGLMVDKDVTILGAGANVLAVNGGGSNRVFYVSPGTTVTIAGLSIVNGFNLQGGGIYNDDATLTVSNCTLSGNHGFYGGGIYNIGMDNGATTLTLWNSTVSSNSASYGGGLYNVASAGGTAIASVLNSTVSGNSATNLGGGIFNSADTSGSAMLAVRNSTFSGNSASSGGGIQNSVFSATATVQVSGTILKAGATGANLVNSGGTVTSQGYNLSSDSGGGFLTATGDQVNIDPLLGPLNLNGGATPTHALSSASPAIDAGDPSFAAPPAFDQRGTGFPRVVDGRIDIGAFEFVPLRITLMEQIGGDLRFTFTGSSPGNSYEIQSRTNLISGGWVSLPGSISGNNGTLQSTVTNAFTVPQQFFRVRQLP